MTHSKQLPDFSARELEIIQDNELFPLKFSTVQKITRLFLLLEEALKDKAISSQFPFPGNCEQHGGKISKGENLDGFPWVVLDYPRQILQQDLFIFRTQCWFGHGFTFSLILKGDPLNLLPSACPPGFQLAINEHIWSSNPKDGIWQNDMPPPETIHAIRFLKDLNTMHPAEAMQAAGRAFDQILNEFSKKGY